MLQRRWDWWDDEDDDEYDDDDDNNNNDNNDNDFEDDDVCRRLSRASSANSRPRFSCLIPECMSRHLSVSHVTLVNRSTFYAFVSASSCQRLQYTCQCLYYDTLVRVSALVKPFC